MLLYLYYHCYYFGKGINDYYHVLQRIAGFEHDQVTANKLGYMFKQNKFY